MRKILEISRFTFAFISFSALCGSFAEAMENKGNPQHRGNFLPQLFPQPQVYPPFQPQVHALNQGDALALLGQMNPSANPPLNAGPALAFLNSLTGRSPVPQVPLPQALQMAAQHSVSLLPSTLSSLSTSTSALSRLSTSSPVIDLTIDRAPPNIGSSSAFSHASDRSSVPDRLKDKKNKNEMKYYYALLESNSEMLRDDNKKPVFDINADQLESVATDLGIEVGKLKERLEEDQEQIENGQSALFFPKEVITHLEDRLDAAIKSNNRADHRFYLNSLTVADLANGFYLDEVDSANAFLDYVVDSNEAVLSSGAVPTFSIPSAHHDLVAGFIGVDVDTLKLRLEMGKRHRDVKLSHHFFPETLIAKFEREALKQQSKALRDKFEKRIKIASIANRLYKEKNKKTPDVSSVTLASAQPMNPPIPVVSLASSSSSSSQGPGVRAQMGPSPVQRSLSTLPPLPTSVDELVKIGVFFNNSVKFDQYMKLLETLRPDLWTRIQKDSVLKVAQILQGRLVSSAPVAGAPNLIGTSFLPPLPSLGASTLNRPSVAPVRSSESATRKRKSPSPEEAGLADLDRLGDANETTANDVEGEHTDATNKARATSTKRVRCAECGDYFKGKIGLRAHKWQTQCGTSASSSTLEMSSVATVGSSEQSSNRSTELNHSSSSTASQEPQRVIVHIRKESKQGPVLAPVEGCQNSASLPISVPSMLPLNSPVVRHFNPLEYSDSLDDFPDLTTNTGSTTSQDSNMEVESLL